MEGGLATTLSVGSRTSSPSACVHLKTRICADRGFAPLLRSVTTAEAARWRDVDCHRRHLQGGGFAGLHGGKADDEAQIEGAAGSCHLFAC
jgi:hypothetical protein